MNVLLAFVVVMILLLVALIKFKVSPAVGLFVAAILMGLFTKMPMTDIVANLGTGFGNLMASIGLVLLFGGILGEMLGASGATEELAKGLLRKVGKKNDFLALNLTGFLVAIPVYFASGFVMLSPLLNSLQKLTKKKMVAYVAALFTGLTIGNCMIAPTPGPVAVASQAGANLGWFILYGIIVGLPASLIGGWLFAKFVNRHHKSQDVDAELLEVLSDEDTLKADPNKPKASTAAALILFPIVLIVIGAVMDLVLPAESTARGIFLFFGNNNVVLFLAVMVAGVTLRKYLGNEGMMKFIEHAADRVGSILMILGTGGCFALVLQKCGLGDAIVSLLSGWNMPVILLAYMLAIVIRVAVGSGTVAMLTTVSIIAPTISAMGLSPVIIGLSICAGALGLNMPTDAAFWMPTKYNGLSVKEAFIGTTANTTIASVVAFAILLLLSAFSHSLPGLFV